MTDWKFGDMVTNARDGGAYMVIGPYVGDRLENDDKGPAVWIADIDTEYVGTLNGEGTHGWTVWEVERNLEPLDE